MSPHSVEVPSVLEDITISNSSRNDDIEQEIRSGSRGFFSSIGKALKKIANKISKLFKNLSEWVKENLVIVLIVIAVILIMVYWPPSWTVFITELSAAAWASITAAITAVWSFLKEGASSVFNYGKDILSELPDWFIPGVVGGGVAGSLLKKYWPWLLGGGLLLIMVMNGGRRDG